MPPNWAPSPTSSMPTCWLPARMGTGGVTRGSWAASPARRCTAAIAACCCRIERPQNAAQVRAMTCGPGGSLGQVSQLRCQALGFGDVHRLQRLEAAQQFPGKLCIVAIAHQFGDDGALPGDVLLSRRDMTPRLLETRLQKSTIHDSNPSVGQSMLHPRLDGWSP